MRRKYVRPAIRAEQVLERTSLACTYVTDFEACQDGAAPGCTSKNGYYYVGVPGCEYCTVNVDGTPAVQFS